MATAALATANATAVTGTAAKIPTMPASAKPAGSAIRTSGRVDAHGPSVDGRPHDVPQEHGADG